MNAKIFIRGEIEADAGAITEVTVDRVYDPGDQQSLRSQFIIEALRAAKALTVSLVAEMDGRVIGHIAFSPVTISGTALGTGSALDLFRCFRSTSGRDIGKALIQEGLSRLKDMNAQGCCLVGHPDYCRKFGFKNLPGFVHEGVPPEFFFALSFDGHTPQGIVTFHEGFKADGQQEGAGDALQRA